MYSYCPFCKTERKVSHIYHVCSSCNAKLTLTMQHRKLTKKEELIQWLINYIDEQKLTDEQIESICKLIEVSDFSEENFFGKKGDKKK